MNRHWYKTQDNNLNLYIERDQLTSEHQIINISINLLYERFIALPPTFVFPLPTTLAAVAVFAVAFVPMIVSGADTRLTWLNGCGAAFLRCPSATKNQHKINIMSFCAASVREERSSLHWNKTCDLWDECCDALNSSSFTSCQILPSSPEWMLITSRITWKR